ncbi:hypothetical protein T484DRAFT_1793227, partial [Baffinella frigidus]
MKPAGTQALRHATALPAWIRLLVPAASGDARSVRRGAASDGSRSLSEKRRHPSTSSDAAAKLFGRDGGGGRGGSQAAQQSDLELASAAWSEKAFERRLALAKDAEEVSRLIIAAPTRFTPARAAVAAHRIANLTSGSFNIDRNRPPTPPGPDSVVVRALGLLVLRLGRQQDLEIARPDSVVVRALGVLVSRLGRPQDLEIAGKDVARLLVAAVQLEQRG